MSYREHMFFGVACDQCRTVYEHDDGYTDFPDKASADEVVESDGWTATRGRHLCPDCATLVVEDPPADISADRLEAGE